MRREFVPTNDLRWRFWNRRARTAEEFITLARVVKTQGRHGEVAVELHSDVPDRFQPGLKLLALAEDGSRREVEIEDLWLHQSRPVLKLVGIETISDAEKLIGCELQIPRSERAQLDSGWTYVSDLIGCVVSDGDREVGKVEDIRRGAGEAPLLIVRSGKREYEIPFAEAYLESVSTERKRITMRLPEGMLKLDAPLTAEEKEQQKSGR
jgi:16S rRNA processing protein RimM